MTTLRVAAFLLPLAAALSSACGSSTSAPVATQAAAPVDDAAAIFARFKAATGGAAWDAVTTLETEGRLTTGGLSGPLTTYEDSRTGRRITRFSMGSTRGARGFDGAHAWKQDPGGVVAAQDAPEAVESAHTEAWLTTRGYFAPGFAQAEVSAPRDVLDGGARYVVVDATPSAGRKVALWFDPQTSLLVRTVTRQVSKTVTSVLGDYRASGGVRSPFHVTVDATDARGHADPREHVDIAVMRVAVNPNIDVSVFAMPEMAANAIPAAR